MKEKKQKLKGLILLTTKFFLIPHLKMLLAQLNTDGTSSGVVMINLIKIE